MNGGSGASCSGSPTTSPTSAPGRPLDPAVLLGDQDRLAALKYVFVTAIEGCLNVAQHVCASEGWGPPESNADAVRLLGRHGVLPPDVAESVGRAVGFRNVLVHGYVDVDDRTVVGFLHRVADLEAFVAGVAAWMTGGEPPGPA